LRQVKAAFANTAYASCSRGTEAGMEKSIFANREEAFSEIAVEPELVFDYLDNHANLSSHMSRRSWMMLGTKMNLFMDDCGAKTLGSRFGFSGKVFGLPLRVEQRVVERRPPSIKSWETVGEPRLWVIGSYRMGFEISPAVRGVRLAVFLDYDLPTAGMPWLLGQLFGRAYGRWCVARMVSDAAAHFGNVAQGPAPS
jgi:hypothetical protein